MINDKQLILSRSEISTVYDECIKFKNDFTNLKIAKKSFKYSLVKFFKNLLNKKIPMIKNIFVKNIKLTMYFLIYKNDIQFIHFRLSLNGNELYIQGYSICDIMIESNDNNFYYYRILNDTLFYNNQYINLFNDFTKNIKDIMVEYNYYTNNDYAKVIIMDNNNIIFINDKYTKITLAHLYSVR